MTRTDCRGLTTSAADQAEVDAFDSGFELFLNYEMSAGGALKQVLADHPNSLMATVLRGYMMLMLETVAVRPKAAQTAAAGLADEGANERERLHFTALDHWARGDVRAAAAAWDRILARYPLDLLALKLHHYTTFWTGRADVLLSAVDGVIDAWDPSIPGYDHVLGMRAFAMNETGRYEQAEALGREAVARNAEDLWSIHAVAHALEMQGALADGDAFFTEQAGLGTGREGAWATKNPFVGHIWWHAALFPWNAGDYDRVLDLYDHRIRPASTEFFLDLQNLASLLTRLEAAGVGVGDRWEELGQYSATRIGDHVLTFTDVHCALALGRTGRIDDLDAFARSLEQHRADHRSGIGTEGGVGVRSRIDGVANVANDVAIDTAIDLAIELCHGFQQRATGDHRSAADTMLAVRGDLAPIGGSHAQRDLFDLVLIEELIEADDRPMAANLLRARTHRWPNSVPTWRRYAVVVASLGDDQAAERANRRAMEIMT